MELYTMEGFKKNSLKHYGLKGQKWGIRRFQNSDGTYTEAGKKRYKKDQKKAATLTRKARVTSRAVRLAEKRVGQAKGMARMEISKKNSLRYAASQSALDRLRVQDENVKQRIKEHTEELKRTYGEDNIKELKVNKYGVVKDSVLTKDVAQIVGNTALSFGIGKATAKLIDKATSTSVQAVFGASAVATGAAFLGAKVISTTVKETGKAVANKAIEEYNIRKTYKQAYNLGKRNIKRTRK